MGGIVFAPNDGYLVLYTASNGGVLSRLIAGHAAGRETCLTATFFKASRCGNLAGRARGNAQGISRGRSDILSKKIFRLTCFDSGAISVRDGQDTKEVHDGTHRKTHSQ